jgi:hypothetical protein
MDDSNQLIKVACYVRILSFTIAARVWSGWVFTDLLYTLRCGPMFDCAHQFDDNACHTLLRGRKLANYCVMPRIDLIFPERNL